MSPAPATVMWFRRDLRLRDHPALRAAAAGGGPVVGLFVLDPGLWPDAGSPRQTWLAHSLRALDANMDGALIVRHGDPLREVAAVARKAGATEVHISGESEPYGAERDQQVEKALAEAGARLVRTGTPYAVAPGTVRRGDGQPYAVYTPFYRQWRSHAGTRPVQAPRGLEWAKPMASQGIPADPQQGELVLPEVGEAAARTRWHHFRDTTLADYQDARERPDLDGTSALSAHLRFGEIHPRTLLADLAAAEPGGQAGKSIERFRMELAWREFYADQLWHHPEMLTDSLKPEVGGLTDPDNAQTDQRFTAWTQGRTGYPIVDAGMRQLAAVGWVHNRVRMIVASFLVKDLHVHWKRGADHFLAHLRDGDPASNHGGWQWVAGTGSDPAPYFRVFNPVRQGREYDPEGDYVRRYVPELREVSGAAVHEPWDLPEPPASYPARVVDHALEREESLRRFAARDRGAR